MKLTPQSTVAEALKNKKAVLMAEKIHPGITKSPLLFMVKKMTLAKLCQIEQVSISPQKLQELLDAANEP